MTKYHINPETGSAGLCKATANGTGCPFGGEEKHFPTMAEARKNYEQSQQNNTVAPTIKKIGVRLENRAAKHKVARRWEDAPATPTDEQLKNASAYARVHGKPVAAGFQETVKMDKFKGWDERSYDGEENFELAKREYIIATPEGNFVRVQYESTVDANFDGYWEFHPELNGTYTYHNDLEALKDPTSPRGKRIDLDPNEIFSVESRGYSPTSYYKGEAQSAINAARAAMGSVPKPYEIAKIAHLENFSGKIPKAELLGEENFKHTNEDIRAAAVGRKEFPVTAQAEALKDPSLAVRYALASRPDISREHIEPILAMTQGDPYSWKRTESPRSGLLRNPKLPLRPMSKIVREGSVSDMRDLHNNPGLTPDLRKVLNERAQKLGVRLW